MSSNEIWNIKTACHTVQGVVDLPVSKSVMNRLQIIRFIAGFDPVEPQPDFPDDVNELAEVLAELKIGKPVIFTGNGGTTYRFSLAAAALKNEAVTLVAGEQMTQRPIGDLVEPLRNIGAEIVYLGTPGFPPVSVKKRFSGGITKVNTTQTGQFAGALALAAPGCKQKCTFQFSSHITSRPYLDMTLSMMKSCGAQFTFENNVLTVFSKNYTDAPQELLEKDMSAASYFYEIAALSSEAEIRLKNAADSGLQGDINAARIFEFFGVHTVQSNGDTILLKKAGEKIRSKHLKLNLQDNPDLAQTVACTAAAVGVCCTLTGLHTLRIKETDRISALQSELTKLGCRVKAGSDCIQIHPPTQLKTGITVNSFNDHRMVMAFAPLVLKTKEIGIHSHQCISKSFPRFKIQFEQLINSFH